MSIDPKTMSVFIGESRVAIPAHWNRYPPKDDENNDLLHAGCEDQLAAYNTAREEKYFMQSMADMCLQLSRLTGVDPGGCDQIMTRAENAQFAMDDAWLEFLKCFLSESG